jgi:hypothetical protein
MSIIIVNTTCKVLNLETMKSCTLVDTNMRKTLTAKYAQNTTYWVAFKSKAHYLVSQQEATH